VTARTLVCAVGDVFVDEDDPGHSFSLVAPLLNAADIVFANCEGVYSDRVEQAPTAYISMRAPTSMASGLAAAGLDVMSLANNHCVDGGHGGLRQTVGTLRAQGIETVGAGESLEEARRPVVVEHNGQRIAFLSTASYFPAGYEARADVPGVNPLRYHNVYTASAAEVFHCPGAAPDVLVVPDQGDRDALLHDVRLANELADVVVVTFHWGESVRPFVVHDFERETVRLAIDTGADVVLCGHQHVARGFDVYSGVPIYHGLCHFVLHLRQLAATLTPESVSAMRKRWGDHAFEARDGYPQLPMHPLSRMTMIAAFEVVDGAVACAGVLPCFIEGDGRVRPLELDSERGLEVTDFLRRSTVEAGLGATLMDDSAIELVGYRFLSIVAA
jgi:poly-gamma-glutamate capsule biosynthesis protein CapA/YwtB (metallophosphatase superfamily)